MRARRDPVLRRAGVVCALAGVLVLAGCVETQPPQRPPADRPEAQATQPEPSPRSAALARYYTRVQAHLLAQGLLRTDGGGVDTPYGAADVARNFERIAFYDEYVSGGGLQTSRDGPGVLRRWQGPVRIAVEFGANVPHGMRDSDRAAVTAYAGRLARVTGHPIRTVDYGANFHVIFASEDDRDWTVSRVRELAPSIGPATLGLVANPPRSIYCMVLTLVGAGQRDTYGKAVAIIRTEQPELMRRSCIHEEVAQGLGLGNDSATARPSIFNDDEEFAFLTSHDEDLLSLLYHPALKPGMTLDEARPIIRRILVGPAGAM